MVAVLVYVAQTMHKQVSVDWHISDLSKIPHQPKKPLNSSLKGFTK